MLTFGGTTLRIVTRLDNAYIYDVEVLKIGKDMGLQHANYELVGGYAASLLLELSHLLDFKIELVTEPPDLTYDFSLAENYSVDMFASSYSLHQDRCKFTDPTFVTGRSRVRVFLNRAFEGIKRDVLVAPFKSTVWLALFVSILLLSATYSLVAYHVERAHYSQSVFQILSIFLLRDATLQIRALPLRVIQLTASITVLLLMSAYAAKIFSIGALKVHSISSLAQLVTSFYDISFDIGYGNGSSLQYHAEAMGNNPVMSEILNKAKESKFRYDTFESAMRRVKSKPFAYIIDEETAFHATINEFGKVPCELGSISFADIQYQWAMFLRKGFENRSAINFGILRIDETGVLKNLARRWIPGRVALEPTGDFGEFSSVQLMQLKTAFTILMAGAVCACLFLALEVFKRKRFDTN